ncbi:MAG TPA: PadR family transcriptional regulator [Anaerolineales bacterium]|nr:PadR family transcriptional regulator [Anaerolineales bacterium]
MEAAINIQDFLPLREPTFFILLSIAQHKKHGYAILKDVETLSHEKVTLSNGTLYGALTRLQDQGLIARVDSEEPSESGRPRKAYQLTETGAAVLDAEINRMQTLIHTAKTQREGGSV